MTELMGSEIYLYLKANDQKLVARVPAHVNVKAEDDIRVAFDTEKIHVFDKETEKVTASKVKGSRACLAWLPS